MRKLSLSILLGFCGQVQSGKSLALRLDHILTAGYDGALIAGLLANPLFFVALGMPSTEVLGVVVAGQSMGTLPGLIPAAIISDRFGRRVAMAIGYLILISAALMLAFAGPRGRWYIFGGRFMVGFGSGMTTVGGAPYTAEIAHPRNRPETTALIQTCFYVGSILAAWVAFGSLHIEGDWSWRLGLLLQMVTPCIALSILPFVPESPRWLAYHERHDEAHRILAKYHANGDMDDELVLWELSEIKKSIEIERIAAKTVTYGTFLKTKGNRWRLAIILLVGFSAQWVGNGIITFYVVSILESIGITDPGDQTAYNGGLQIWNWFSSIGGAIVCERFGRRKLWLTSCVGQFISYAVITLCSALYANGHGKAGYPVLAFLYIYFFFYAIAVSRRPCSQVAHANATVHTSLARIPHRDSSLHASLEGRLHPPPLHHLCDPAQHVHQPARA